MFNHFKTKLSSYNRANNSLIDKNFNLDTNFIKVDTLNVTKPMDLYISNLKGPSWIMIKIVAKDDSIAPTTGIKVGQTEGPYVLSVGKNYTIYVKAGTKGVYHLQVQQNIYKILFNKEIGLTTDWSDVYKGNTNRSATQLYIENSSGASWMMIKIRDQWGNIIEAPTSGIPVGSRGGPYYIAKGLKFIVMIKASNAGNYTIVISDTN